MARSKKNSYSKAYSEYAKALKKSVKRLSTVDKQQALLNHILNLGYMKNGKG